MKNILFLFLSIFFSLQPSLEQTDLQSILPYCVPSPALLNIKRQYNLPDEYDSIINQDCRNIPIFPEILNATQRDFKCCDVFMKSKSENSEVPNITGCIAVMSSYIDDDRYEDIIDYFERGKQYKLQNYFIMLGYRTYMSFYSTYLPRVNGTKYEVIKFDCFSEYKWINILLILELLFLIY